MRGSVEVLQCELATTSVVYKYIEYLQIRFLILSAMEPKLYKWLPFVCPLGLVQPNVKFNNIQPAKAA